MSRNRQASSPRPLDIQERQPLEERVPELSANSQKKAMLRQGHSTHHRRYYSAVFNSEGRLAPLIGKGPKPPYLVEEGSFYIEGWYRGRELVIKIWRFRRLDFFLENGEWAVKAEWVRVNTFNRQGWCLRLDPLLQSAVNLIDSSISL